MNTGRIVDWLPLPILPAAVILFTPDDWPRWAVMWLLAAAIFVGCKWLTWRTTGHVGVAPGRRIGYLIAWPGMDAAAFLHTPSHHVPPLRAWLFAAGKLGLGVGLIEGAVAKLPPGDAL